MDFSRTIGKKLIWSGSIVESDGFGTTYLLFEDMTGLALSEGRETEMLRDAKDVLTQVVAERLSSARSIIELGILLEHEPCCEWIDGVTADWLEKALSDKTPCKTATERWRAHLAKTGQVVAAGGDLQPPTAPASSHEVAATNPLTPGEAALCDAIAADSKDAPSNTVVVKTIVTEPPVAEDVTYPIESPVEPLPVHTDDEPDPNNDPNNGVTL